MKIRKGSRVCFVDLVKKVVRVRKCGKVLSRTAYGHYAVVDIVYGGRRHTFNIPVDELKPAPKRK